MVVTEAATDVEEEGERAMEAVTDVEEEGVRAMEAVMDVEGDADVDDDGTPSLAATMTVADVARVVIEPQRLGLAAQESDEAIALVRLEAKLPDDASPASCVAASTEVVVMAIVTAVVTSAAAAAWSARKGEDPPAEPPPVYEYTTTWSLLRVCVRLVMVAPVMPPPPPNAAVAPERRRAKVASRLASVMAGMPEKLATRETVGGILRRRPSPTPRPINRARLKRMATITAELTTRRRLPPACTAEDTGATGEDEGLRRPHRSQSCAHRRAYWCCPPLSQ